MKKIRVLIVDDHFMARMGLSVPINGEHDMMVIAEARNGAQALELYRHHQPDVVTMDCMMTDKSGIETTREILAEFPEARILMLSGLEGEEDIFRAVDAGACGYLTKAAERDVVLSAIRQVDAGQTAFPAAVAVKLAARQQREPLTERELNILGLIVQGRSNKEIVTELHMSGGLVKKEISSLLAKLGAADRTRAATLAIERGIVHL
ncbi:MAG: response regulator transcription factor [Verrucomicrobiaceae bacterium]|nr:response regulator transcription factor [Verrucomicrobiaceae bacterium]